MQLRAPRTSLILFLVLSVVLALHYTKILAPIESLAVKSLSPIGSGFYRFGQKIQVLWKPKTPSEDYERLQSEKNQLIAENTALKMTEEENQRLRNILDFRKENQYDSLVAEIIGRDPDFSNHFILNRGTRDGLQNNFPVISPEGILVGKILKAEENVSVMIIPADTNFQTAATILGKTKKNTSGLLHGEKGLGIKMEFIPQDEVIEAGDVVATSGLELNMPKGLVIGKITKVKKEPRDVFGEATVGPLVDYEKLNLVSVLLPNFKYGQP